jgi:hypothetical protein
MPHVIKTPNYSLPPSLPSSKTPNHFHPSHQSNQVSFMTINSTVSSSNNSSITAGARCTRNSQATKSSNYRKINKNSNVLSINYPVEQIAHHLHHHFRNY